GGDVAEHGALHAGFCAFENEMAGKGMNGVQFECVQHRIDFEGRVGRQVWSEIPQLRNAQEKFQHAAMEKRLGFLIGGDLREGVAGGFSVEASENLLENVEVRGAH